MRNIPKKVPRHLKQTLLSLSTLLLLTLSNSGKASQVSNVTSDSDRVPYINPALSSVQFFKERSKAFDLVQKDKWGEAVPMLARLTSQYQDDGDLWFLLGHGYLYTEDWANAISALTNAIKVGTILTQVKGLSHTSNDIMVEIAKAHNRLNQTEEALKWLQKAIDARWDGRPTLTKSKSFKNLLEHEPYKKIAGSYTPEGLSRDEQWQYDLKFLAAEIQRLHVAPFHTLPKSEFLQQVQVIHDLIPTLTDQQITFQFMKLVASLGNAHNVLVPTYAKKGNLNKMPLTLYKFSDGLFIVDAAPEYEQWIGYEIVKFGETDAQRALALSGAINARDNNMQMLWIGPHLLTMGTVLEELEIVKDGTNVQLTLSDGKMKTKLVTVKTSPFKFREMPPLPTNKGELIPKYLAKSGERFWLDEMPKHKALYVQFNLVTNGKTELLSEFSQRIQNVVKKTEIENLILDLRHNNGGNGALLPPLLRSLINFETTHPNGKLFVLFGRKTFSAAHLLLAQINQYTDAILVGEASGSKPNHIGESGWFRLPFSGLRGVLSSQFHQASKAEDHRAWIPPHVPVTLSSSSYFAGKDPALEVIKSILGGE